MPLRLCVLFGFIVGIIQDAMARYGIGADVISNKVRLLTVVLVTGMVCSAFSQQIENLRASFGQGKVTVLYDITGGHPRQTYSIRLLGSHSQFSVPLRQVTGDVGEGVTAGKDKKIVWDAESELVTFSGALTFQISGSLIPMKLSILSPVAGTKLKRGKEAIVRWEGGLPDASVKMELYSGRNRVVTVGESKNTGTYQWVLPRNLQKGEYTIHLTAGTDQVASEAFSVKGGLPKSVLIGGGAVVVGVVVWLLLPDSSPSSDLLPVAPDP